MIPKFYVMEAARQANYRYYHPEWQDLPPEEKEDIVAHFILRNIIEGHKNEVVSQDIESKSRIKG